MSDFRDFFSKNAEAYSKSASHKTGADLGILVDYLEPGSGMQALDLATGTGFTAAALAEKVSRAVAYDATQEMLDQARKLAQEKGLTNIEFRIGDVMDLKFEDNSFDIITCRRAAHHFTDMKRFLSEALRVLKPGGKLGIADMARPETDDSNIFNKLEIIRDNSHVGALKVSTWKEILAEAGFSIDKLWTSDELYTLERWLSPVSMESEAGKDVIELVNTTDEAILKNGNVDRKEQTILKPRIVIVAVKK